MAIYVLIHGGFHDGSAWNEVIVGLHQCGHTAYAPTLAGRGRNADNTVTHGQASKSAVDYILQRGLTDVILVGHSVGGTVICKVVEAIPERISRLVFYAGVVPLDGESIYDASPPSQRLVLDQWIANSVDGTITLPFEAWRDGFIADADLELARWAYEQPSPEPCRTFLDRIDLKTFHTLTTPRCYLLGTEDHAMPPGGWHPHMTSRLGHCRLVQMPGGHEMMFSNPRALVGGLIEASDE